MEIGTFQPVLQTPSASGTQPRQVEAAHHGVWRTTQNAPAHADAANTPADQTDSASSSRGVDRVEFSNYLQQLNAEQRLRDQACDDAASRNCCETNTAERDAESIAQETTSTSSATEGVDPLSPTKLPRLDERYLVINRAATGRLIDMLM